MFIYLILRPYNYILNNIFKLAHEILIIILSSLFIKNDKIYQEITQALRIPDDLIMRFYSNGIHIKRSIEAFLSISAVSFIFQIFFGIHFKISK
jgi:hypothetical protein